MRSNNVCSGWRPWILVTTERIFDVKSKGRFTINGHLDLKRERYPDLAKYFVIGYTMSAKVLQSADARTVSRELGGLFEAVFPRLVPSIVGHMNRKYSESLNGCRAIPVELVRKSSLQKAMLFEIAVAVAEMTRWERGEFDLDVCIFRATQRQRKYYDAKLSKTLTDCDKEIVFWAANNMNTMLDHVEFVHGNAIVAEPSVPGFGWIANSIGDYACGNCIVEVKCSGRPFSSADYRQVTIYWLLAYMQSLERQSGGWENLVLLNPRMNIMVSVEYQDLLTLISGGRSTLEIVQAFAPFFSSEMT